MTLKRMIAAGALGLLAALIAAVPAAAAPVPSLEGAWLVGNAGEGRSAALVSFGAEGTVTVVVPGELLSLPDGSRWSVVSPGQGNWRSRGFPDGEMTVAFLTSEADAAASPVLRLSVRIRLAETGQRWTSVAWLDVLNGSGRDSLTRTEVGVLTATRVLYGRW